MAGFLLLFLYLIISKVSPFLSHNSFKANPNQYLISNVLTDLSH